MTEISLDIIFKIFLILSRLLAAFIVMPVFGEKYITTRIKIIFVLFVAGVCFPHLEQTLPSYNSNIYFILELVLNEILIGLLIGMVSKIYFLALQTCGMMVAMQSGLSAANFFNINKEEVSVFANLFIISALTFLIITDAHYHMLYGIIESYNMLPATQSLNFSDISDFISKTLNNAFILGFQISSPFLIVGMAMMVGGGLLSRLMPNFQVFFVITPAQIWVCLMVMLITINKIVIIIVEKVQLLSNSAKW